MRIPTATYRLQVCTDLTFDMIVDRLDSYVDLGVSHLYLSPVLQAAAGSTHGYDVVDPTRVDTARGGLDGLLRLSEAAHRIGLGLVVDIVPNHLSVAVPQENPAWWDVLRIGRDSGYAPWFDIDWAAGPILLPVLADDGALSDVRIEAQFGAPALAYGTLRFPIRPGTEGEDIADVAAVHARQAYRLVGWKRGAAELTYRRFFDVTSLAGVRVEDPDVYAATHALILQLVRDGVIDGLRIDHPDGLADPAAYLERLHHDTGGVWTVVEKILEPGEHLPQDWACAGTTGYDAARLATGILVDPDGERPLTALWNLFTGRSEVFAEEVVTAEREIVSGPLAAEVARLSRLAPELDAEVIAETLVQFPVYRSYVQDEGAEYTVEAVDRALEAIASDPGAASPPNAAAELGQLEERLLDPDDPLALRFQQTSGMVMAKGVEDTAFYRYHRLIALNEVGGAPGSFGVKPGEWHAETAALQAEWPTTMTLLSSHDTKRSEDVRARLVLLAQVPNAWTTLVEALDRISGPYHGTVAAEDRYLLHQTLVGTGEIEPQRLVDYLHKATREAKRHTAWVDGDSRYDADVETLTRGVLADPAYQAPLRAFLARLHAAWLATVQAQKVLQLTMPGVPDVYQGCERISITLVDPDNRRPIPAGIPDDVKTPTVRSLLRLRCDRPELFSTYEVVAVDHPAALAYARSADLIVVVTRFAIRVERAGWEGGTVALPAGAWRDMLTGLAVTGTGLDEVLGDRGAAVLVREAALVKGTA